MSKKSTGSDILIIIVAIAILFVPYLIATYCGADVKTAETKTVEAESAAKATTKAAKQKTATPEPEVLAQTQSVSKSSAQTGYWEKEVACSCALDKQVFVWQCRNCRAQTPVTKPTKCEKCGCTELRRTCKTCGNHMEGWDIGGYLCSECGVHSDKTPDTCPNCGRTMSVKK